MDDMAGEERERRLMFGCITTSIKYNQTVLQFSYRIIRQSICLFAAMHLHQYYGRGWLYSLRCTLLNSIEYGAFVTLSHRFTLSRGWEIVAIEIKWATLSKRTFQDHDFQADGPNSIVKAISGPGKMI